MSMRKACVIGWPVEHSRSPVIHRYWLKEFGIEGDYVRQPVPPEEISAFLAGFAGSGYVGGNVTVPHKEAAFAAVADMDDAARAIGAVNTIWLEDDRLLGANTDGVGFLANLDQCAPGWERDRGVATVLGAGGAARAIIWALKARGFDRIRIVNRTLARAEALAQEFGKAIVPVAWPELPTALRDATLLVNTTSLGMAGKESAEIDLASLKDDALVTDIVYVPLETPLLAAAHARGLRTIDGLGMLLHQAVPGFERWFGRRPSVTPALRELVIATLGGG
jgi:shikimate dehydrogenase